MHVPGRLDSEGGPAAQPAAPATAPLRPAGQAGVGAALRRARKARGIALRDAEQALHIRERHLLALEAERFDDLPGEAYGRLFLRAYAEYLGLDGDRLLELLAHVAREEEEAAGGAAAGPPQPEPVARVEPVDPPRAPAVLVRLDRGLARMPHWARRAAWLAPALALLLVVALRGSGGSSHVQLAPSASGARAPTVAASLHDGRLVTPATVAPGHVRAATAATARVELSAPRGDCWLLVRDGSAEGPVLFEGMLHAGGAVTLQGKELWLRVGAPWNLAVRVNGRAAGALPTSPASLVVSARGVRLAD